MALLLVRMVVTGPFWEMEAVPLTTPLRCTAAPAGDAIAAAIGAMAQRTIVLARRRLLREVRIMSWAGVIEKFTAYLNKEA